MDKDTEYAKLLIRRGWDDHMYSFENMDEQDENWLMIWAGERAPHPEGGLPEDMPHVSPSAQA